MALTNAEKQSYNRALRDCYNIMLDLYLVYGDYSEVQVVFEDFKHKIKQLKK
jgi:Zn-dependent M32 family carboxypeptidase